MLKTLIIEDEKHVRDEIKTLLSNFFESSLTVLAEATSVKEGIKAILEHKPDLVFLDIDLGDGSSFDILAVLPEISFDIIFVTGYDSHAIKAIRLGALDYLLKPIDNYEFKNSVKKAIDSYQKSKNKENLVNVAGNYYTHNVHDKIVLKTLDAQHLVNFNDIVYCKSDGNYTTFHLLKEQIVVSKPMKKIQPLLNGEQFIKCHQSYIVNASYVTKYRNDGFLITKTKATIPVATRRKDEVLQILFK
ncbi:two component transcriptional regulator, LytTR family [Tenacibaculum sp. MAR_2009_124]|uniref:LytR/AlgR family response regulator transcription factor n=1 Tax=Tenacibaculum sp. MAR_2009_124 TaxID=1250059 RepID=UPI000894C469|nr:LytTR family DNA-binding domain-containing protein [Tenacibaculum sp. MAR_2009_124]SEC41351.1 two component transcriptional regulator, LytTR family [Tenacibaculum sp. MAR_2009_124]